jgi:hypothetical protein
MAVFSCPDCGGQVSELAPACPHCGRPFLQTTLPPPASTPPPPVPSEGNAKCPHCGRMVTPVVTSVGGGSCSVGNREKWTCPSCKRVMHRSGFFVATAVYGDEDLVEVHFLRLFRDRYLLPHRTGRALVWAYYHLGPYPAWVVERVPGLRPLARNLLDTVIAQLELRTPLSRHAARDDLLARKRSMNPRR